MKGSVLDLPFIGVALLGGAISIFFVYLMLTNFTAGLPASETEAVGVMNAGMVTFTLFDQLFMVAAVGMCIFSVISAFFVDSHPVFFIFSVIGLMVVIFINTLLVNVFWEFATNPALIAVANNFPYIIIFMKNLPIITLLFGLLIAIVTHGKAGGGSQ